MPGAELNILLAMAAGLLSFLSPCVLPLLPSYLSFIAGLSFEELQGTVANARTRRAILINSLLFILGFSIVFVALGAGATLVGQALFRNQALFLSTMSLFCLMARPVNKTLSCINTTSLLQTFFVALRITSMLCIEESMGIVFIFTAPLAAN